MASFDRACYFFVVARLSIYDRIYRPESPMPADLNAKLSRVALPTLTERQPVSIDALQSRGGDSHGIVGSDPNITKAGLPRNALAAVAGKNESRGGVMLRYALRSRPSVLRRNTANPTSPIRPSVLQFSRSK